MALLAPGVTFIAAPALASTDPAALVAPPGVGDRADPRDALRLPACEALGRSLALGAAACPNDLSDALVDLARAPAGLPAAAALPDPPTAGPARTRRPARKVRR